MQAGCVSCHNSHHDSPKTDWKVGDVRGVLEIIRPLDAVVAQTRAGLRETFVLMATMAGLGLVGLALVIDMLAGGLSGGWCSRPNPDPPLGNDVVFILLDPARFAGFEHFVREVTGVAAHVRSCPAVDGAGEILLPGDPERRTLAERSAKGIPIDAGNWKQIMDLAATLGVSVPKLNDC